MEFKTIELKESIFANNDREADRLRAELKGDKTFLLNLIDRKSTRLNSSH